MITNDQRERLLRNWPVASALHCNAEVRLYDPLSKWECFLIGMNPQEENEVMAIISGHSLTVDIEILDEILSSYNVEGQNPLIDDEYSPRHAVNVLKHLRDKRHDTARN